MTRRRRISSAALTAAVGAALFVGVGSALPVWTVPTPVYVTRGPPTPDPRLGYPAEEEPPDPKGMLWAAASATLDDRRALQGLGAPVQVVRADDVFVVYPLLLLAGGAVC